MSTLEEASLPSLKEEHDPDQSSLSQFGATSDTTIAVVSKPTRSITDVCDEWMPALGMPEEPLNEYWNLRSDYSANQYVSNADAASRAYEEANLDARYKQYVRGSRQAQKCIDEIVRRLDAGENITLVCYEQGSCCHRHTLKEMIEKRREAALTAGRARTTQ